MASITKQGNGRRAIQFTGADRKRRTLRLGKAAQRTAEAVKVHVERLVESAVTGHALPDDTSRWVSRLDEVMQDRLARVGLVPKRERATLKAFLDAYLGGRTDVKARTVDRMSRAARHLVDYFGAAKPLREISQGDIEEFRRWLQTKVADNTARRRLSYCRQFFRFAVKKRLIPDNPFAEMKGLNVRENRARDYFVTLRDAQLVLDACPNSQWRLIFALSRFGGLRCPSEHMALEWGDVDWERNLITVRSPKTERYEGKASRIVPLFPELRPYLEEAFDQAEPGTKYVLTKYRDTNQNLRTGLKRIIRRAGLTPWEKLFQNVRATRATELTAQFPAHVAAEWMGHSTLVAQKHYWRVTDDDYRRAVAEPTKTRSTESDAESDATGTVKEGTREPIGVASDGHEPENPKENHVSLGSTEKASTPGGRRTTTDSPGNPGSLQVGDAESDVTGARNTPPDTDLEAWLDACPLALDQPIKADILALLCAARSVVGCNPTGQHD